MMRKVWTTNRAFLLVISSMLMACGGRSSMELEDYDGGTEAGSDAQTDAPFDVVYDHVNDINGCNPDTCGGCCDDDGDCRTGLESAACGIGGYACVNCTSFNATCSASTHTCGPAGSCGPSTCPDGCCDDGVCVDGTDSLACGGGGAACATCPAGTGCDPLSRQCVNTQDCGPWNCSGCCDAVGACNWGGDTWACGMGGQYCDNCAASGQICNPYTWTCEHGEECGPWNCAGCCDAYGYCNWGGDAWACGWGGNYCDDCLSMGMTCDPDQAMCIPQQDCGPWNCDGCCDVYGYCNWGVEDWACGVKGQMCDDCLMGGGYCDPNYMKCQYDDSCGPWNCGGCCTNTYPSYCVEGLDQWECGSGGQTCEQCYPGQTCEWQPYGGGVCIGYQDGGPPDCGPWNCDGCCMDGYPPVCMPGIDPFACGMGGETCTDCQGGMCEPTPMGGGVCMLPPDAGPGCGPWNCNGCCTQNGSCRPGTSDNRCGSGARGARTARSRTSPAKTATAPPDRAPSMLRPLVG